MNPIDQLKLESVSKLYDKIDSRLKPYIIPDSNEPQYYKCIIPGADTSSYSQNIFSNANKIAARIDGCYDKPCRLSCKFMTNKGHLVSAIANCEEGFVLAVVEVVSIRPKIKNLKIIKSEYDFNKMYDLANSGIDMVALGRTFEYLFDLTKRGVESLSSDASVADAINEPIENARLTAFWSEVAYNCSDLNMCYNTFEIEDGGKRIDYTIHFHPDIEVTVASIIVKQGVGKVELECYKYF